MTIFEAFKTADQKLAAAGIEDSGFEAKQIIYKITGFSGAQVLANYNSQLTEFQENNLVALIHQREVRYPLQYIFGEWDFYGRPFKVGPGVLIPRSDTEIVTEEGIRLLKNKENPQILDLCAGSGCIGITLAKEIENSAVVLVEKYDEALFYTEQNKALNSADNAKIIKGDIFLGDGKGSYDLIISNPPYISQSEMKYTSPEVKFEPETALFAEDEGLEFYKAIIKNYKSCLKKDGAIVFEVGFKQAAAVKELLSLAGFENINIQNDLNGIGRAVSAIKVTEE